MQVSMNAEDATINVRSRRTAPSERPMPNNPLLTSDDAAVTSKGGDRQSVRLIDLSQELPSHVEFSEQPTCSNPSVQFGFFDEPFNAASLERLPHALLDADRQEPRDPFDLSHLKPPPLFAGTIVSSNNASSQSTPSLPIAVAGRSSGGDTVHSSDLSTSTDHETISSPASMRLSSSADSALAALPPPPPPPDQTRLPNYDEIDACGCSDHPNLPPRAVFQPADRPRILPIIENGQRTSYTHYWVIPPRINSRSKHSEAPSQTSASTVATSPNQCSAPTDTEHYVNLTCPSPVTRSVSMPLRTRPKERRYVKRPSGDTTVDTDYLGCATNRAFVDDALEDAHTTDVESGGLDSSLGQQQVVSSVESDSSWEAQQPQQHSRVVSSAEERRARIVEVRESVHGVTDEEALMILQTHRWEVQRSIYLLKVEQLFRLGVTPSKSVCKQILDDSGGDLSLASSRLIKQQTVQVMPTGMK